MSAPRQDRPDVAASDDPSDRRRPASVYRVGSEPDPRFSFANERTFLAWMRTALGFLAAGVAIAAVGRTGGPLALEVRLAALVLVGCGAMCGIGGLLRWMQNERALRLGRRLPSALMMPLLVAGLVIVALAAVVVVETR